MTSHASGNIVGTRQGSYGVLHTLVHKFSDPSGVTKAFLKIKGSPEKPGVFRILAAVIITPNDASISGVLSVGTVAAGTDLMAAQNIKAAAGSNLTLAGNPVKEITADTKLYLTPTYAGTAPTAGETHVLVEVWEANRDREPEGFLN